MLGGVLLAVGFLGFVVAGFRNKRPDQAEDNVRAADLPQLTETQMAQVQDVYDKYVRDQVHHRW